MNRKIKFRAWDIPSQSMVENVTDLHKADIYEQPLMQFTGLLDKNGKEIYEGDIMKGVTYKEPLALKTKSECIFAVGWSDQNMGWYWKNMQMPDNFRTYPWFKESEIIGNIYENPELLTTNRHGR